MSFASIMETVWEQSEEPQSLQSSRELIRSARNPHGDSLLHIAAAEGNLSAARALIDLGCDPNCQNHFGSPPIDVAAWKENKKIVELLLIAGANINITDSTGSTVLENLQNLGKTEMADWISEWGASDGESKILSDT